MEPPTARELIQLMADRSSAWQSLWTVFYTVSAVIVSLVGYLLLAAGNYQALNELRAYHWGLCVTVLSLFFGIPHLQKRNE